MKLLLVCTTMVLLLSAVELSRSKGQSRNSITQMYRAANATPIPESLLQVYFDGDKISFGMEIAPEQAIYSPVIEFDYEPGVYHTCLVTSPDWPSPCDPFLSDRLLYIIVNIIYGRSGDKTPKDSYVIASWLGPSPPPGTGLHRFYVNCYEQQERLDTSDKTLRSYQYVSTLFSLPKFAATYGLISPPAFGTVFFSQYPMKNNNILCQNYTNSYNTNRY